jgi:hypothetical protein
MRIRYFPFRTDSHIDRHLEGKSAATVVRIRLFLALGVFRCGAVHKISTRLEALRT